MAYVLVQETVLSFVHCHLHAPSDYTGVSITYFFEVV
jgi:hypothetical protein